MPDILTERSASAIRAGRADGNDLWLSAGDAERAAGWTFKPEGFCMGDVCVPVPPARTAEFVSGAEVNVAALWRHLGLPLARNGSGDTWALGESAAARSSQLASLQAPDFALPDLAGVPHALNSYRGRKVLLVSWASW